MAIAAGTCSFGELLVQFYRSCADHSEAKLLSKYLSYDCLLIDEIGVTTRKCQNCPVRENQTWTILGLEREIAPLERVKDAAGGIWSSFQGEKRPLDCLISIAKQSLCVDCRLQAP